MYTSTAVQVQPQPAAERSEYRIAERIGMGAAGTVYRVIHNKRDEAFAMKVLKEHVRRMDCTSLRRFMRECRAMSKIHHPNVVQLVETGMLPSGAPYMIMRLLRGNTLRDVMRNRPLPVAYAVQTVRAIATALIGVHDAGVVHRDLSPGNVFMHEQQGGRRPTIIDFGNALVNDVDMMDIPDGPPGIVIGTPHYMAPEQIRGEAIDARTDLYSLGAMFFELLDGEPPFDGYNAQDILLDHLTEPPPEIESPYVLAPEVERIVMRCLEKDPDDRYQSAMELVADLDCVWDNVLAR